MAAIAQIRYDDLHMKDLRSFSPAELQDVGLYLQSLLLIMAADGHLHALEQDRVRAYALEHSFEKGYVEEIIASVVNNRHMPRSPGKFNSRETAQAFLMDAVALAFCDGEIHAREMEWLLSSARANGLDPDLVLNRIHELQGNR